MYNDRMTLSPKAVFLGNPEFPVYQTVLQRQKFLKIVSMNWHNWWPVEKSNMASKMVVKFSVYDTHLAMTEYGV